MKKFKQKKTSMKSFARATRCLLRNKAERKPLTDDAELIVELHRHKNLKITLKNSTLSLKKQSHFITVGNDYIVLFSLFLQFL